MRLFAITFFTIFITFVLIDIKQNTDEFLVNQLRGLKYQEEMLQIQNDNLRLQIEKLSDTSTEIEATVTAYNTVRGQTDDSPCVSSGNNYICGRRDVVACPRNIDLGTWVEIDGTRYECLDRTALRFGDRFDISFDKDIAGAKHFGIKHNQLVKIYE